jgi:hypothetical protein
MLRHRRGHELTFPHSQAAVRPDRLSREGHNFVSTEHPAIVIAGYVRACRAFEIAVLCVLNPAFWGRAVPVRRGEVDRMRDR